MGRVCYGCGNEYSNLANHWSGPSCERLEYHPHQIEIIEGLLLGDGTVTKHPPNAHFQIGSTNVIFLEHLERAFGCFSGEVCFSESADAIAKRNRETGFSERANPDNYNDYYKFRTMASERLNELRDKWYNPDKSIPDDFSLSHRKFKYWYVSDGTLKLDGPRAVNPSVNISNVSFDTERCVSLIRDLGYDARPQSGDWIRVTSEDSSMLLENLGSPVPGFEYKWEKV